MTSRSYELTHLRRDNVKTSHEYESLSSGNSPRVNGRLKLRANTLTHTRAKVTSWGEYGTYVGYNGYSTSSWASISSLKELKKAEAAAQAAAYARLRGRLYKGNASLGVTTYQWKQSRDMIIDRSRLLESSARDLAALLNRKTALKKIADVHLETIFGWAPLVSDIHAAATSVIQRAADLQFVSGRSSGHVWMRSVPSTSSTQRTLLQQRGTVRCTMATGIRISNPNLWLLERAGLTNPAAVLWDSVPFSFLVNMVSNTGQLVNAITDFTGLSFVEPSTLFRYDMERYTSMERLREHGGTVQRDVFMRKRRTLGGISPPKRLTFKLPDVNWETAAMAASLAVQQAVPILRLVQRLNRR